MKTTADMITITPGAWRQDTGPDPTWRVMTLAVTGAAPGTWTLRNNGPGWYMHLKHNDRHIGVTHWNAWDTVRQFIAHESGPCSVAVTGAAPASYTGATLTEARMIAHRSELTRGCTAVISNADGNEVRFPRTPDRKD